MTPALTVSGTVRSRQFRRPVGSFEFGAHALRLDMCGAFGCASEIVFKDYIYAISAKKIAPREARTL
jgi:hypothetical protein